MQRFPDFDDVKELIRLARREDLGPAGDDVTSRLMIPPDEIGVGMLVQKEAGVACGLPIVEWVCDAYDPRLRIEPIEGAGLLAAEGQFSDRKVTPLLTIRGPLRSLLSAERVVLNFLQHLSGVATHTNRYVQQVAGTSARIYDTRKTLPGLRLLDKYAVRSGGGHNHRIGLYDGLLVKDNHVAAVPLAGLYAYLTRVVDQCRSEDANRLVEIEVDSLDQFREVLKVEGVGVILLDNMDCPTMESAVALRDAAGHRGEIDLEASGGVTLASVRSIAATGVDRIAIGAITHSAPALDISLDIQSPR